MKIETVHIKNYRSLHDVKLEGLGDLVILIGPNSSGKSNFMEILSRFFAEIDVVGMPSTSIDRYLWYDENDEEPIEVCINLKLDEKEFKDIFPPEVLNLVKEGLGERYQRLSICRQIVKASGWQTKSIEWAGTPLLKEGKYVTLEDFAKALSINPFEDLLAVFFAPGASNTNITGDRLIIDKSTKKAYYMGPYSENLVRSGKIEWINVSQKTTDWKKYIAEEGYTPVGQEFTEQQLRQKVPWLDPQQIHNKIITKLKGRFRLIPAARDVPQNPLQRSSFLDYGLQRFLSDIGAGGDRFKEKRWSKICSIFQKITGLPLDPYLRVMEQDLNLPIHYRGSGEQELLCLLIYLTEEDTILGIEEPELHTHPQLARQIFYLFKELSKEKQIFIVTHSIIFVDLANINNVWLVKKQGKETVITRMSGPEDLPNILCELGVRPSDIFFSEAVIFVEGSTEKIVLPILAEKMDINLRSPKVSIIPTYGKNRGKYHVNVWIEASKAANIPFFMIFDKDAENDEEIRKFIEEKKELKLGENLFILKKGSLEDYYPLDKVIEAIKSIYGIELNKDEKNKLSQSPRVQAIEEILKNHEKELKDKKLSSQGWKVRIGEEVAKRMGYDEIDGDIKAILERIRVKLQL